MSLIQNTLTRSLSIYRTLGWPMTQALLKTILMILGGLAIATLGPYQILFPLFTAGQFTEISLLIGGTLFFLLIGLGLFMKGFWDYCLWMFAFCRVAQKQETPGLTTPQDILHASWQETLERQPQIIQWMFVMMLAWLLPILPIGFGHLFQLMTGNEQPIILILGYLGGLALMLLLILFSLFCAFSPQSIALETPCPSAISSLKRSAQFFLKHPGQSLVLTLGLGLFCNIVFPNTLSTIFHLSQLDQPLHSLISQLVQPFIAQLSIADGSIQEILLPYTETLNIETLHSGLCSMMTALTLPFSSIAMSLFYLQRD